MSIPPDFGRVSDKEAEIGTPIANKGSILADTDAALGFDRPPKVEYILVRPFVQLRIPFTSYGVSYNTFGHAAVRYTLPSGQQFVMNVEGLKANFVAFRDPSEYFYGTDLRLCGDQRALYNRSMITVRLYDELVSDEQVTKLHEFYVDLQRSNAEGKKRFFIVPLPIRELLLKFRPDSLVQYGNCAKWTSDGLSAAGIIAKRTHWPKSMWIAMFEGHKDSDSARVVSFRAVKTPHSALTAEPLELVAPLQTLRSVAYFNLDRFAHLVVDVPPGESAARITVNPQPDRPSAARDLLNSRALVLLSTVVTGGFLLRQTGALAAVKFLLRSRATQPITRETLASAREVAQRARQERRVEAAAKKEKQQARVKQMRESMSRLGRRSSGSTKTK